MTDNELERRAWASGDTFTANLIAAGQGDADARWRLRLTSIQSAGNQTLLFPSACRCHSSPRPIGLLRSVHPQP